MDLLITGATGFVGSHLAVGWLLRHPEARVGCLVRAADDDAARERLRAALRRAAAEGGTDIEAALDRAEVIRGDVNDPGGIERAGAWPRGPTELVHCAANLSFREADRAAVWRTNVDGTALLLRALATLPGVAGFNYVSTAYVAGNRQGNILEGEEGRPERFNNPYEESKWAAESLVRAACATAGLPWRILRPSIIVAHSVTHRMSTHSGFYQVVDALLQFARLAEGRGARSVVLPVKQGTTLDLIPVDFVVKDAVALIDAGDATANLTFHVTGLDPLPLAEVLRELTPMSGVSVEVEAADAAPPSPAALMVMRRLRHYMPYFGVSRRFDQNNLRPVLGHVRHRMGLDELRGFVRSYLEQRGAVPVPGRS